MWDFIIDFHFHFHFSIFIFIIWRCHYYYFIIIYLLHHDLLIFTPLFIIFHPLIWSSLLMIFRLIFIAEKARAPRRLFHWYYAPAAMQQMFFIDVSAKKAPAMRGARARMRARSCMPARRATSLRTCHAMPCHHCHRRRCASAQNTRSHADTTPRRRACQRHATRQPRRQRDWWLLNGSCWCMMMNVW